MIDEAILRLQWALAYPFARPDSAFVFVDGETYLLSDAAPERIGDWRVAKNGAETTFRALAGKRRADMFEAGDFVPVVAVGSNAAPVQLRRKFADRLNDVAIPVIRMTVSDHVIAWGKHIAPYGSIGSTIAPHTGASVQAYATLLPHAEFEAMNATENLGGTYVHHDVVALDAPGAVGTRFTAYRSLAGHMPMLVKGFGHENPPHPYGGQWEAQEMAIAMLGLDMPVDRFILENTADPAKAADRDEALART